MIFPLKAPFISWIFHSYDNQMLPVTTFWVIRPGNEKSLHVFSMGYPLASRIPRQLRLPEGPVVASYAKLDQGAGSIGYDGPGPQPQISWTKSVLYLMKHPHLSWISMNSILNIFVGNSLKFTSNCYPHLSNCYTSWFSHDILNIHCFYLHLWSATCIDDGLQQRILADHVPSLDVYIGYGIFILVY